MLGECIGQKTQGFSTQNRQLTQSDTLTMFIIVTMRWRSCNFKKLLILTQITTPNQLGFGPKHN